jgi:hypothetical protein
MIESVILSEFIINTVHSHSIVVNFILSTFIATFKIELLQDLRVLHQFLTHLGIMF